MTEASQSLIRSAVARVKQRLRGSRLHGMLGRERLSPPLGSVNFGRLGTAQPISYDFGWDRGTPIDRYYIENFLAERAGDIQGRVLEVGDDEYSTRYGGSNITRQDVLHVHSENPKATLIGDLTRKDVLPNDAFDCIVLTQTLQLIFELEQAVRLLDEALKPGGILLLTVPGISQIDRDEWGGARAGASPKSRFVSCSSAASIRTRCRPRRMATFSLQPPSSRAWRLRKWIEPSSTLMTGPIPW